MRDGSEKPYRMSILLRLSFVGEGCDAPSSERVRVGMRQRERCLRGVGAH